MLRSAAHLSNPQIKASLLAKSATDCANEADILVLIAEADRRKMYLEEGYPSMQSVAANLRLRCRAHNQLEAERLFGKEFMEEKRRRPPRSPAEAEPAGLMVEGKSRPGAVNQRLRARKNPPAPGADGPSSNHW